jgi:protein arginine kinase activator
MSDPHCDLCGGQHATVRFTEIDDGQKTKRTICRTCAEARGLLETTSPTVTVLQKLLSVAPVPKAPAGDTKVPETADRACPNCGLSLATFRRQGRLGCATCWTVFEAQLVPILRNIQPNLRHVGKAPRTHARQAELRQRFEDLRAELERAVRGEDYERAAHVRDEIRALERIENAAPAPAGDDPAAGSRP